MNVIQARRILPLLVNCNVSPWLWGYHGKGKTETVTSTFENLGWKVFNVRFNCIVDVGDFLGLQEFVTDSKTGEKTATKFCMPDWLKKLMDFCEQNPNKGGIIFVDEANRAARFDLVGPLFSMALDKRLHTFDFPSNLHVICASNPDTADYSVLSMRDKALFSRFCHLTFSPSREEWFNYAKEKNYNRELLAFLNQHPEALEESDLESFNLSEFTTPDRRKISFIDKILKAGISPEDRFEVLSGFFGIENAASFEKFLENADPPIKLNDILENYSSISDKVKKYSNASAPRLDILNNACKSVKCFITENSQPIKLEHGQNIVRFMEDLPDDLMFSLLHSIYQHYNFQNFAENNYSLFASLESKVSNIKENT